MRRGEQQKVVSWNEIRSDGWDLTHSLLPEVCKIIKASQPHLVAL